MVRHTIGATPAHPRALWHPFGRKDSALRHMIARKGEHYTDAEGRDQVADYDHYGPVPFWDTGRNQIVLLMLLEPNVVKDIM